MDPAPTHVLPALAASPLAWLTPLLQATTPRAVAVATAEVMRGLPGCRGVRVLWRLDDEQLLCAEPDAGDDLMADFKLARAVLAGDWRPQLTHDQRPRLSIPLPRSGAVVLLDLDQRSCAPQVIDRAAEPL